MHSETALAIYLQELEESLLQPSVRTSECVSKLLADEFFEFGSSGRMLTKEQIITSLLMESPVNCTATEFNVKFLAPQIALVTYRVCRHGEPPVFTVRSSIWQQLQGQWQMVFHQGTISSAHSKNNL